MPAPRLKDRNPLRFAVLATAMLVAALLSLTIGARADVGLGNIMQLLFTSGDSLAHSTVHDIRLPRTITAGLVGINLSLAGLVLQAITRNPIASPSVLGINQGAALGLTLGVVFPAILLVNLNVMALLGAVVAGLFTFTFAGGFAGRFDSLRLILSGVAVGALSIATVRFTFLLEDNLSRQIVQWTTGDISGVRWPDAAPLAIWSLCGIASATLLSHKFNLMALGEDAARGLGLNPRCLQLLGALSAAVLTGVSVVAAGPVSFVGLVIPHICRRLFGDDHRVLIPACALTGATLMFLSDAISKLVNYPYETPVGVICALIGAPYFLHQVITAREIT
jgi:ABC-type Fe3+-siderophore transport system permease subunit